MKVAQLLAGMELTGMAVHLPTLKQPLAAVEARQAVLTRLAERSLGRAINLASPQQVSEALYVTLRLPKPQGGEAAAKAGHGSTADAALQALVRSSPQCPLPAWVLEYREVSKLRTAFLEPYIERVVDGPRGARLFCTWQQMATGTGRLSARAPNLQQVPRGVTPVLGADGEASLPVCVRSAFVASPGCVLLAADYKQLEIRLFAAFSSDPQLQREVRSGGDLFVRLAAMWYKKPCEQVTAEERSGVKTMVYGLVYGLGIDRLAGQLSTASGGVVSQGQAREMRQRFLKSFPTLGHYMEQADYPQP